MKLTKAEREAAAEIRAMIQGDFVETLARTIPDAKLRRRVVQDDAPLELERPAIEAKQTKLL